MLKKKKKEQSAFVFLIPNPLVSNAKPEEEFIFFIKTIPQLENETS